MQSRIDEAGIRALVSAFYGRVRGDETLGPIFEARIGDRWDAHLDRMCDFWATVLLASCAYRGNPAQVHAGIGGLRPEHFARWMELFERTAHDVLPEVVATDVVARAARMRVVLERSACSADPPGIENRAEPHAPSSEETPWPIRSVIRRA